MAKQKPTVKPKEVYTPKQFLKAYQELCDKMKFRIVVTPTWRVSQDTGDWRLVLQTAVGEAPKKENSE